MRLRAACVLFCWGGASMLTAADQTSVVAGIRYGVDTWDEALGNHRALVRVTAAAPAVRVHLPWRRRDHQVARTRLIIQELKSGREASTVARIRCEREAADIAFEPVAGAGDYAVYFLPFTVQKGWGGYGGDYLPPEAPAAEAWLQTHGLTAAALASGSWQALPEAACVEIQARGEFNRMDPMEVPATAAEVAAFLEARREPYLVFAEDRRNPIRMRDELPWRWLARGTEKRFDGDCRRHEYYTLQLGIYAARTGLEAIGLEFSPLRQGNQVIAADRLTCFNTTGSDWLGRELAPMVTVPQGQVQALWLGVDVPRDAVPGPYAGTVTVRPANAPATVIAVQLTVAAEELADRGDSEPWRHSRLRWLNSTLARDDLPTPPFTPVEVSGRRVSCLGREVELAPTGLPASIRSQGHELLAAPLRLVIEAAAATPLTADSVAWSPQAVAAGRARWLSRGQAGDLAVTCEGSLEADGYLHFTLRCKAGHASAWRDLRLEIPMRPEMATYFMGCGREGGRRPESYEWHWPTETGAGSYFDSFWMGDVHGGLHCELRGADYCGPMVNLYWRLGQLQPPETWGNHGRGGCRVTLADGAAIATAFSGPRDLAQGEEQIFEFALIVTPVKPLDTSRHFRERYYHSCAPPEEVRAVGGNLVNVHHGTPPNPYINYPFIAADALRDYVTTMHAADLRVKIYYTVRELTNHITELWALRSLGHEVLAGGGGGGYPWLREHLADDYSPSWYQHFDDTGDVCASMVNSGASRWYNYHIEGLQWLLANTAIDGLYLDDVSYDRETLKRIRKALDRTRPGSLIDLHSNTAFSIGPANQYMEFLPYVDRLWFGEGFDYNKHPDYWLVEASGIPFGLMGDMLQNGGNRWRGMVYGMTTRMPWTSGAAAIWKVWDAFGIDQARMLGYWEPDCPVRTDHDKVLATAYVRPGRCLVAVASWNEQPVAAQLNLDWQALGIAREKASFYAPPIDGYQPAGRAAVDAPIPLVPGRGWLLWVDTEPHQAPPLAVEADQVRNRRILLDETFRATPLAADWSATLSPAAGASVSPGPGGLTITTQAHSCAFVERALPAETAGLRVTADSGSDGGMSWGLGVALVWPERFLRLNLRPTEGRVGVDDGRQQWLYPAGIRPAEEYQLGIRIELDRLVLELSLDGSVWWPVAELPREGFPGAPTAVRIGKMAGDGSATAAAEEPNPVGTCAVRHLQVYAGQR